MRIGVIHNLCRGGAHRRLAEHVSRFQADTVEICLATAVPVRAGAEVIDFHPTAGGVARPLRPLLRYLDLAGLLVAWRKAVSSLRAAGVDVVYANPCRYLQAPPALLATWPPSLYFCDEPRRVDHESAASASRSRLTRPAYAPLYAAERRLDRLSVARATQTVTNSAFSAAGIDRAYGRQARVIPMGVPELCFTAVPRAPDHILSVGTLIPSKGHDLVIKAAALASRSRPVIVIAPRPDGDESARLHRIARDAGVRLEVRVATSDSELVKAYAAAHATVYMARDEPFGLASLEAQAAGSPVIVSAEGGLPETIDHGRSGWAVARSAAAVAAKLDELDDPARRDTISAHARIRGEGASWSRSAAAVEAILEQLCS